MGSPKLFEKSKAQSEAHPAITYPIQTSAQGGKAFQHALPQPPCKMEPLRNTADKMKDTTSQNRGPFCHQRAQNLAAGWLPSRRLQKGQPQGVSVPGLTVPLAGSSTAS